MIIRIHLKQNVSTLSEHTNSFHLEFFKGKPKMSMLKLEIKMAINPSILHLKGFIEQLYNVKPLLEMTNLRAFS